MRLSLEIYQLVISHLTSRADIASLCRVSRTLRNVAERALYNTLYMGQDSAVTVSLCETLSSQARLARLVAAMTIDMSEGEGDRMDDGYWAGVAVALQRTTQLRVLNIRYTGTGFVSLSWILTGCTFHLRSFHSDLKWDATLTSFLSRQDHLKDVYLADYVSESSSRSHIRLLPNLSTFESASMQAATSLTCHRPITHVCTRFSPLQPHQKLLELTRLCTSLQKSEQPVASLEISDLSPTETFTLEFLSHIVFKFDHGVDLRYLGTLMLPIRPHERLKFYALLMCLSRLRHIQIDISHWRPLPLSFVALRALASELKLYCTEILTVVFVRDAERIVLRYLRGVCVEDVKADGQTVWKDI